MATPFSVFRKHQRAMMAVIGILCMIAFTVGSVALDFVGGRADQQNPVVATTDDGEIHESDLRNMVLSRQLANSFVRETLLSAYGDSAPFKAMFELRMRLDAPFGEAMEGAVVEANLKARRAEELGVVVSDDAINAFLRELSEDKVTANAFRAIVKRLNTAQPIVFASLRTELLARKLEEMVFTSIHATPAQRWDYYQRLNSRATVEVLPVAVERFVDQISDPSPDVLQAFFEAHKAAEPLPGASEPGFKVPQKAVFQYFKADYDKFFDEKAVTQEEIEKHYEEKKDQDYLYTRSLDDFKPAVKPGGSKAEADPDADEATEGEPDGDDAPDTDEADADATDADETDADDTPADDDVDEEPAGESDETTEPDGDVDADEGEDEDPQESEADATDDGARLEPAEVDSLAGGCGPAPSDATLAPVALLQDESAEDEVDDVNDQGTPDADESDATESEAGDAEDPEAAAGGDTPGAGAGAKTVKAPPPITTDLVLPTDINQGENPKYDPLWKVEGSIRKLLAGQKAVDRIEEVLNEEQSKMRRYAANWTKWSVDPETRKEPKKLDFAAEARESGLTAYETSLVSAFEVKQLYPDLADAKVDGQDFASAAFANAQVYQSRVGQDSEGNRYLFWIIEYKDAYVPELSEVRDQVVRAWKLIQARELAQKKADEMVGKARESKKPLAEVFASDDKAKVVESKPFSWMTTGTAGNFNSREQPRLSEVQGPDGLAVIDAGDAFMRQVFSMEVGDVGAAMNQPQTIVYVIRVTSLEPSRSTLRELFMVYPYQSYASVSAAEQQQLYANWLDDIKASVNLEWVRAPDDLQTR